MIKIGSQNAPRPIFRDFGAFLGEPIFYRTPRGGVGGEGLPGRVCGSRRGFGACKFVDVCSACFAPQRGRRVQSARAHSAGAYFFVCWFAGVCGRGVVALRGTQEIERRKVTRMVLKHDAQFNAQIYWNP